MQFVTLPFDNLTYNLYVKSEEDIEFILPHLVPNKKPKLSKVNNTFLPSEEIVIKVAVITENVTPKLTFIGDDEECNITESGSLELLPNSVLIIEFTTSNGGLDWLVHSCNGASNTAEGAETIAKNALKVARRANARSKNTLVIVNETKTIAENAVTIAEDAKLKAETAITSSEQAANDSTIAKRRATRALNEAQTAVDAANAANNTANEAKSIAENSLSMSQDTQQKLTEVENLVDTAVDTADKALTSANEAKTVSAEAKKTSEFALKTALDAKTIATDLEDSVVKKSSAETQTINSNLSFGYGYKLLLDKSDNTNINGISLNQYNELTDKYSNTGLEQVEVGSSTTMLCLNHTGTTYTDADGVERTVDGHIRVDYRETPESSVTQDQLAYMSDVSKLQAEIEDTNNNKYLKLVSEDSQKLNSSFALANGKQMLMQKANGSSYVGLYSAKYDELLDLATNIGLEQLEIGSTTVLMCLNHCGATYRLEDGSTATVDHHIRVDYRENINSSVVQDQLAYMSDINSINGNFDNFNKEYQETIDRINTNYDNLKSYAEENVNLINSNLVNLNNTVNENQKYVQDNIQTINSNLDSLSQTVNTNYKEYKDNLDLVNSSISTLSNTINTNNTNINTRVDQLASSTENSINSIKSDITGINNNIDILNEDILNLSNSVLENKNSITELKEKTDSELSLIKDNLITIESNYTDLNNKVDSNFNDLNEKIDANYSGLNEKIETNKSNIDSIQQELNTNVVKLNSDVVQNINSDLSISTNKKFMLDTLNSGNIIGMFVGAYDNIKYDTDKIYEQLEIGSTSTPMCLNHTGMTIQHEDGSTEVIDGHIRVDYRLSPDSEIVKDQLAYLSDISRVDNELANRVKISSDTTQELLTDLAFETGHKLLLKKFDGGVYTGVSSAVYNKLIDTASNEPLEMMEIGSPSVPMHLNHCGVRFITPTGTEEEIDYHIAVDYRKSIDSPVITDQLAYMSDIRAVNLRIDDLDVGGAELKNVLKLTHEGYQTLDTGLILKNGRKFLLENHSGGTSLGFYFGYYDELKDKNTGAGLEQVEIGSSTAIMCLNHCGTTYTDAEGTEKTIDGHIRVNYRETPDSPIVQDQLAYMSDINNLKELITSLTDQLNDLEIKVGKI